MHRRHSNRQQSWCKFAAASHWYSRQVAVSHLAVPSRLQVASQSYFSPVSHISLRDWLRGLITEESYIRKSGGKWEARHCQRWMLYCRSPSNSDSVSQLWAAAAKLTNCRRAAVPICPAPLLPLGAEMPRAAEPTATPADGNVAVGSHGEYFPTLAAAAAWCVNAAVSTAAWWPWPLTFWPWKWCPSHVWRGLPVCQCWSS